MTLFAMVSFIISTVLLLVGVAFITLLERKILGYMQLRLGPNKLGFNGLLQPLADAIKLYTKETSITSSLNKNVFFICPPLSLSIAMMIWISFPFYMPFISLKTSLLMFLSILGLGIYPILISGWSSNSNYSMLGAMRALAQTISYEVSLIFIVMSNMIMFSSMSFSKFCMSQKFFFSLFFSIQVMMLLISIIAELNRTPFDFAEGESELVSGFNTEYSSSLFAIIFMAEYMMIMFFSLFLTLMLMGFTKLNFLNFFFSSAFMFFMIWIRATLPRYRYDKLMFLSWKIILPLSSFNLIFSMILTVFKVY
uniref:NADH-ubiquinone oxidoreductase chain 1 n=1 Tax=Scirtothrips dorsalis TaxID=163899 RepID=A0A089PHF8_SCIDO|nr:NADH dehydrogenase subunit 1 [Scirtothrips dorsalis]AIQ81000.1 NADH dehydrogenase subunit 1 [Scirtothrips dorsalis]